MKKPLSESTYKFVEREDGTKELNLYERPIRKTTEMDLDFTLNDVIRSKKGYEKRLADLPGLITIVEGVIKDTESDRPEVKEIKDEDLVGYHDYISARLRFIELKAQKEQLTETIADYEEELSHVKEVLNIPEPEKVEEESE